MKIILAGYNVDRDALDDVRAAAAPRMDLTPETLSAAYARISRDARPVDELRRDARAEVEKARRSARTIIFKMGHHSVAEHAVFNFDLMGLSRLAIEEIEKFRLCSYTEKSQRYITLGEDFVVPEEIEKAGGREVFTSAVRLQNGLYHRLHARLRPHLLAKHPDLAGAHKTLAVLEGWAKEDARYIVSLATEGQLGLTVNGRNLELMIRRFAAKPSAEVRAIGLRLYELASEVAPSLVLFTEATRFDAHMYDELAEEASRPAIRPKRRSRPGRGPSVRLVKAAAEGETRVLAALLHTVSGRAYDEGLRAARRLDRKGRTALFRRVFRAMQFYDFPPREFEHADFTFELVVSASCFAQLKRHRMATLTVQPYDPALGVTVPRAVEEIGARAEFLEVVGKTEEAHARLRKLAGPAADYVLTNAHRRRVLLKLNLRELYHLARLRQDAAAQWDIRAVAAKMTAAARRIAPSAGTLLGGKDAYPDLYKKLFGRLPDALPPGLLK